VAAADDSVRTIAEEIVRYLDGHPNAADTVEGIVQWWLARQRYDATKVSVQRALDKLEQQNRIRKSTLPDGATVYAKR
jgi:Fe2+ or Zn2+ uptake regulation protein